MLWILAGALPLILLPGPVAAVRLWFKARPRPEGQVGSRAELRGAVAWVVVAVAVSAAALAGLVGILGIAGASLSYSDSPRGIPPRTWLLVAVSAMVPTGIVLALTWLVASTGRPGWTTISGLVAPVLMLAPYVYVASLSY